MNSNGLLAFLCVVFLACAVTLMFMPYGHSIEPRLERRDVYCRQVQFQAEQTRDNLRNPDKVIRDGAREEFKILALGGWSMANMCSAVHVGATCDDDDLPCQLAALDWAMVNIR